MKKFETGKEYSTPSICDYNCLFSFIILKRTEKSVWIRVYGNLTRRQIEIYDNTETFYPFGKYSMAPIIKA